MEVATGGRFRIACGKIMHEDEATDFSAHTPFALMMPETPSAPSTDSTSTGGLPAMAMPTAAPAPSDKKTTTLGSKRLVKAFFYSMEGLGSTWKHEEAFRQEMLLAFVLVPVAVLLPVGLVGKALMIGSVMLVLIVELLNSGLEWCVDLAAQQQRHPFAKRA